MVSKPFMFTEALLGAEMFTEALLGAATGGKSSGSLHVDFQGRKDAQIFLMRDSEGLRATEEDTQYRLWPTHIHTHTYTYTHTYICSHIYIHTLTYTYTHTYTHSLTHSNTHIHTHIHMHTHTYLYLIHI